MPDNEEKAHAKCKTVYIQLEMMSNEGVDVKCERSKCIECFRTLCKWHHINWILIFPFCYAWYSLICYRIWFAMYSRSFVFIQHPRLLFSNFHVFFIPVASISPSFISTACPHTINSDKCNVCFFCVHDIPERCAHIFDRMIACLRIYSLSYDFRFRFNSLPTNFYQRHYIIYLVCVCVCVSNVFGCGVGK